MSRTRRRNDSPPDPVESEVNFSAVRELLRPLARHFFAVCEMTHVGNVEVGPVGDQKNTGLCYMFTALDSITAFHHIKHKRIFRPYLPKVVNCLHSKGIFLRPNSQYTCGDNSDRMLFMERGGALLGGSPLAVYEYVQHSGAREQLPDDIAFDGRKRHCIENWYQIVIFREEQDGDSDRRE